jgi:hypothetical protein
MMKIFLLFLIPINVFGQINFDNDTNFTFTKKELCSKLNINNEFDRDKFEFRFWAYSTWGKTILVQINNVNNEWIGWIYNIKEKINWGRKPDSLINFNKIEIDRSKSYIIWNKIDSLNIRTLNLPNFKSEKIKESDFYFCLDVEKTIKFITGKSVNLKDYNSGVEAFNLINDYVKTSLCVIPDSCFLTEDECFLKKYSHESIIFPTIHVNDGMNIVIELLSNKNKRKYFDNNLYILKDANKYVDCAIKRKKLGDYENLIKISEFIFKELKIEYYPIE